MIEGVSKTRFAPDAPITREQLAVMLDNALKLAASGAGTSAEAAVDSAELEKYADRSRISAWARQAAARMTKAGVIGGMPDGTFAPGEPATRAQAAAMLKRFLLYIGFMD